MRKQLKCDVFLNFKRLLLISSLILITASLQAAELTKETASDFQTLYPGVLTEKEKTLVQKFIADNKLIEERGKIDIKAMINGTLPKDTPGYVRSLKITEAMVRYFNELRDPENPLLNNAEYARKAGYQDIIAYPTLAAHDDSFMAAYPTKARDTLLVSDLIHHVTYYRPVYPGDTLYWVLNSRHFNDLTPETGSIYRSLAMVNNGSVYNQRGEKILDVSYTVQENIKVYKEGQAPKNPTFNDMWEERESTPGEGGAGPGAGASSATYYYTDEDWKILKELWSKEKRQGATPLYWEDVNIGDQPTWTLDGPLDAGATVAVPWGMGLGGCRTLKKDILDPGIFKTLVRSETDGIYRPANEDDYILPIPKEARTGQSFGEVGAMDAQLGGPVGGPGGAPGGPPGGAPGGPGGGPGGPPAGAPGGDSGNSGKVGLMAFSRRDYAIRHISDWMGDSGQLHSISWGALYTKDMVVPGEPGPVVNPETDTFRDKAPKELLKAPNVLGEGKGDNKFVIIRSYVCDKYVRDGDFFVELIWWIDTISGNNSGEGRATVKLPSRKTK